MLKPCIFLAACAALLAPLAAQADVASRIETHCGPLSRIARHTATVRDSGIDEAVMVKMATEKVGDPTRLQRVKDTVQWVYANKQVSPSEAERQVFANCANTIGKGDSK